MWEWHNRRCVWDKNATALAREDERDVTAKKRRTQKRQEGLCDLRLTTEHEQGEENLPKMSPPGEKNTARQGKPLNTIARRQPRGYALDNWKILEEKLLQKGDWRRKERYCRGGQ